MSAQQKRLFVGGLNSGTTEKDIRERFKTFGSVSSIELHKVQKNEGFPEKTFAYIDIESSESNIRRCISMLTNTKWRGGTLKIELAKENFMTRLKKERELVESEKTKLASNQSPNKVLPKEIIEPVKNAVPGTPVNGQKNWVVGKFGRALPIVHMRPKHGNKILKFDPSKTVHNLKRIKDEGADDNNVAQLTWNIESRGPYPWDTGKNKDNKNSMASSCSDESSNDDREINVKPKKKAKVSKKKEKNSIDDCRKGSYEDNSPKQIPQKRETDCNGNFKKRFTHDSMENDSDSENSKSKRKRKSVTNEECEINNSMFNESHKEKKKEKDKKKEDLSKILEYGIHDNDKGDTEKVKEKRKKKKGKDIDLDQEDNSSVEELNETNCSQHDVTTEIEKLKQKKKKKSKQKLKEGNEKHLVDQESDNTLIQIDIPVQLESKNNDRKLKRKDKKKQKEKFEKNSECSTDENEVEEGSFKKQNSNELVTCEESTSGINDDLSAEDKDVVKRNTLKQGRSVNDKVNGSMTGTATDNVGKQSKTNTKSVPPNVKTTEKFPKEKVVSSVSKKANSKKKVTSNEKRLQAIKEREMNTTTKQSIVSSALQNLDKTQKPENSKHITFDDDKDDDDDDEDDDDEEDEKEGKTGERQTKQRVTGKVSGSKAANWLGLDSDSDDSSNEEIFGAKPQFEGKTGQKLFQLQKSYRGDSRFQLDKRFINSDDDIEEENPITASKQNDDSTDDINVDDDAKVKKQLSQEKDMAMSVLRGILGENFGSKHESSTRKHTFKDASLLRYDPTKDDHAQFEQAPKKDSSPEPSIKESQPTSADDMRSNVPEVGSDKFYDVKTDALTEMFSEKKKDEAPSTFTFLSSQNEDENEASPAVEWGEAEELKSKPWNPVMLPYDSSGDEQDDDDELPQQEDRSMPDERFFFHFGDPELESRVYDQENAFMRTATLEELNQHWVNVRSELTQDYKKKHKDAMRRNSKMAAKRARMR